MRIDAHQHFWRIAQRAGHWPPASLAAIHRDFVPADLRPELQRCSIVGTVLVQSLPTAEDTTFLLNLAARHEFVLGVVGWIDLKAGDAAAQVTARASQRKLKGLRPMLQDLPDDAWIDDRALDPAVLAMLAHGLCFDALVQPRHLGALLAFARRHPALPIVIDHAAKPDIARAEWQPWHRHMTALAALPNVHCKLSGLLTEAGDRNDDAALRPWIDHLFASFGAPRLMWGSDWPVLNLAGNYEAWFSMAQRLCSAQPGVDADALDAIFGGNARRFYRLD
jgi:L-fuconolactonase